MTNARNRSRVQGGNNYHLKYNRLFRGVLVEGSYSRHNGEVSDFAVVPGPRNTIVFRDTDVRTLEDEQRGGFGLDDLDQRDTAGYKGSAVVQVGLHAIHGGVEFMRNTNYRDTVYDGGLYVSLSPALSGLTAENLIAGRFTNTQFDPTNSSDYSGFIRAIDGLPNRTEFYGLYDGNRDGTITQDELAASLSFDSAAGNPARRDQLRPAGANRAGVAGDALRRSQLVRAGHVHRDGQPVVQPRRAHRAVRALRDRRHERVHLRLDVCAAPQCVVRPVGQRPAAHQRVLRPLLRPDPATT